MKPEGLGAYDPPEDSITLRSGWRVDPDRAARGYAVAISLGGMLTLAWLSWGLLVEADPTPWTGVERAATAAPWVVGCTLLAIMGLGATKRCFGFGRGTGHAFIMAVLFQVATFSSGLGDLQRESVELLVGVPLGGGLVVALFLSWRHRRHLDVARQAVAGFGYFAFAFTLLRAASLRFELHRALGGEGGAMVSAGVFFGAGFVAIPWLWRSAKQRSDKVRPGT